MSNGCIFSMYVFLCCFEKSGMSSKTHSNSRQRLNCDKALNHKLKDGTEKKLWLNLYFFSRLRQKGKSILNVRACGSRYIFLCIWEMSLVWGYSSPYISRCWISLDTAYMYVWIRISHFTSDTQSWDTSFHMLNIASIQTDTDLYMNS